MKYIVKQKEPQELLDWKKSDKMFNRGKPNWNRVSADIKDILRAKICSEQGYICCYCERELNKNDFHIEHFYPKDRNRYPEKQLEYMNLFCSCQLELEKGEPRHCGNSKGSWFDESLIVSPIDPTCENRFKYTFDGSIDPTDSNDKGAVETINRLKLCIEKLNKLRSKAIEPFIDETLSEEELKDFVDQYLVDKEFNSGRYNEFYTTIKYLFGR